jgi:hypothetical protein
VSASGTVEIVNEKEEGSSTPDGSVFIKARWSHTQWRDVWIFFFLLFACLLLNVLMT